MWDILKNMQVFIGLLASCLSVGAAIIAMAPRSRRVRSGGHSVSPPVSSDQTRRLASPPTDLDFWEKAESVGKGILEGICNGGIAGGVTMLFLCLLLWALFFALALVHIAHFTPTLVWIFLGWQPWLLS